MSHGVAVHPTDLHSFTFWSRASTVFGTLGETACNDCIQLSSSEKAGIVCDFAKRLLCFITRGHSDIYIYMATKFRRYIIWGRLRSICTVLAIAMIQLLECFSAILAILALAPCLG